jgi:hypothetical protein
MIHAFVSDRPMVGEVIELRCHFQRCGSACDAVDGSSTRHVSPMDVGAVRAPTIRRSYPPIRVVLYEDDNGHGVFEYDQPSSTFGQLDDVQGSVVARGLDAALQRVLVDAPE